MSDKNTTILITEPVSGHRIDQLMSSFGSLGTIKTRSTQLGALEHGLAKLFISAENDVAEMIVRRNASQLGIVLHG